MKKIDVAIIGAGPAGISCAIKLLDNGRTNFMLYEKGHSYENRYCYVDHRKACTKCNGICNVISGFGGCIHYGDSVKLSIYPSGKRLYNLLGENEYYSCLKFVSEKIFHNTPLDFKVTKGKMITTMDVKDYGIYSLNSKQVDEMLEKNFKLLQLSECISLETMVKKIVKKGEYFYLTLERGIEEEIVCASKIIIATGREGLTWWKEKIEYLGIRTKPPTISLGFRFELEKKYLINIGKAHQDLKLRFVKEDRKFKTFCFCAGTNGGRIKCENYDNFTTLDGHILMTEDEESSFANFALLMQLTKGEKKISYQQLVTNYIEKYKKLSNNLGTPIFQSYCSFRNKNECQEKNNTSLGNAISAPLWKILDLIEHKLFCQVADEIFRWIMTYNKVSLDTFDEFTKKINVLGIEIESLWDTVLLDTSMMTNVSGVYVIGDCAGIAQGIIPAAISGVHIAKQME